MNDDERRRQDWTLANALVRWGEVLHVREYLGKSTHPIAQADCEAFLSARRKEGST